MKDIVVYVQFNWSLLFLKTIFFEILICFTLNHVGVYPVCK